MGGIVRDILGGESPVIFRREIYATAGAAGAVVFLCWRPSSCRASRRSSRASAALTLRGLALRNRGPSPSTARARRARRRMLGCDRACDVQAERVAVRCRSSSAQLHNPCAQRLLRGR